MSIREGELQRGADEILETRVLPRALAALPELATALYVGAMWLWPMRFGREALLCIAVVVALERALLLLMGGLRLLAVRRIPDASVPALGALPLIVGAWLAKITIDEWWYEAPERFLVFAILGAIVGKLAILWFSRRNPPVFDATVYIVQFLAVSFGMMFAMSSGAPELGLTPETVKALGLPPYPNFPLPQEHAMTWARAAAGALSYFLLSAVMRFCFLVRR